MVKKVKIVLTEENKRNIGAFLKSQEVADMLNERGDAILSRLGRGYALSPYVGKTRPNVMIYAESFHARLENLTNNTILKAVQGK